MLRQFKAILFLGLFCVALPSVIYSEYAHGDWQLRPFQRVDAANPIISPLSDSTFYCPLQNRKVNWEVAHTFNPAAVVRHGKVYLFYRAEDDYGTGIGYHTSRIGLAISYDGVYFKRMEKPVLFPDLDGQQIYEFPGGCEDPRVVEAEDGSYVMTYTQWNGELAVLAVATSPDLICWKKHGYAFSAEDRKWSKSGAIVCRLRDGRLIAAKIQGKYWMYWGEGEINVAVSDDLLTWEPLRDPSGALLAVLEPRPQKFDSMLVESGPPAILTDQGIILLYNGKNSPITGDPLITPDAYSAGQVLFDANDPTRIISRAEDHFLTPEREYEKNGQYSNGTVFIQGIVYFRGQWFLYYGTADSSTAVAICS